MLAASVDSADAPPRDEIGDDQPGEHAVARGREVREHDVARLLAADREIARRPSPR